MLKIRSISSRSVYFYLRILSHINSEFRSFAPELPPKLLLVEAKKGKGHTTRHKLLLVCCVVLLYTEAGKGRTASHGKTT